MPLINRVRGAKKLVSIIILAAPTTTTYKYGTAFNPAGMVVQAIYSNGKIETITDYTYSPTGNLTHETSAITISYTEKKITATVQQEITVIPILSSIAVTTMPTKTTYEYGNTFDRTGMVITATYTDGSTAAVTNYTVTPTSLTTLGTQNMTISYTEDEVSKTANFDITVTRITIANVPSQSNTLTYNGNSQSPTWNNYNSSQLTLSGTTSASNAGEHTVTFTPKANYMWADGTIDAKEVTWTIGKMAVAIPTLSTTTYTYDGNAKTPTQNNYDSTYMTRSGTSSATNAGNYSITYTLKANYKWSDGTETDKTLTWKINQASRSITVGTSSVSLTNSNKSQIVSYSISAGGGTISYSSNKTTIARVKNSSGYNIEIYQGSNSLPINGTAIITISITAAGNYKAASVTISVSVDLTAELSYYGTATALSKSRSELAAATAGTSYALFACGAGNTMSTYFYDIVEAYSSSLTKKTATAYGDTCYGLAGASIGNYAVFGGGGGNNNLSTNTVVNAYNTSLTKSTPSALTEQRSFLRAASNGTYLIFAGGAYSWNEVDVDAYNSSLTKYTSPTTLASARSRHAATNIGNYALFAGGGSATTEAYNKSLTKTTASSNCHTSANYIAAASVGNYAIFAGDSTTITAYNSSLTRSTATVMSSARIYLAGTSLKNTFAIFGGGNLSNTVDVITDTLTKSTPQTLSQGRSYLAAASIGDYALFAGGGTGDYLNSSVTTVDVYTI